jgi:hypothetical protein
VDSAGAVWLEDCTVLGADGWFDDAPATWGLSNGQHGVLVDGGQVILQRCTVRGGQGAPVTETTVTTGGGSGVWVAHGRAALHGCSVTGGDGSEGEGALYGTLYGGNGVGVWSNGFACIAGGTTTGGSDGDVSSELTFSGAGVLAYSASSFAWVRDGEFAAGEAELPGGPQDPVSALNPQTITAFAAPSRGFSISSPLREGQAGELVVHGQPGDQPLLLASAFAGTSPFAAKQGLLLLGAPELLPVSLSPILDPGGELLVPFTAPHLTAGLDGLVVLLQLAVVREGVVTLEGGSAFAWLSQAL